MLRQSDSDSRIKADTKRTCHAHKRLSSVKKIKLRLKTGKFVILILRLSGIALEPHIDNANVYISSIV